MFCEHPSCSSEANTICEHHCHLSVCQKHRQEHENNLLNEIEKQLDDLSYPVSTLLTQTRYDLKESEESRQAELTRINSLFDRHQSAIDQRTKLSIKTKELVMTRREQLLQSQTGDNHLTRDDYQQMQNIANQIKKNLLEQYQLSHQISTQNNNINSWPIDKEEDDRTSTEVECIELTDSEDERSQNIVDTQSTDHELFQTSSSSTNTTNPLTDNSKTGNLISFRDFCPLTKFGVFGLDRLHHISHFCPKPTKKCYLYSHFTRGHHMKSSIAYQLVKAIRNHCNPMDTKIFPAHNQVPIDVGSIQCPFDKLAMKFNENNAIPNTPCSSSFVEQDLKAHLRNVHSITKTNTELIYNAMKNYGSISHVQFEEDLCGTE